MISTDVDFLGKPGRCAQAYRAGSLGDLRTALHHRLERGATGGPMTLDISGHTTRGGRLLRLGRTPIDMLDRHVAQFFRDLARSDLLTCLGVREVRLLGCQTAATEAGQRTMRMLEHSLGVAVFGTQKMLVKSHFDEDGFKPVFHHLLHR